MEVLGAVLDVLFPGRCVGCGRPPAALCPGCLGGARPAPAEPVPAGVDWWVAAFAYEGAVREALARVKYRNARSVLPALADVLGNQLVAAGIGAHAGPGRPPGGIDAVEARAGGEVGAIDLITWPPTTDRRRWERGFDQAEHLARLLGRGLGVPVRRCLSRVGGPSQTGRSARERHRGPAFTVVGPVSGQQVLVVDDIATTGATLTAAATALRRAGAAGIGAATMARTPLGTNRVASGADRSHRS